ncbi:sulfite exporter TauE/SafE family protein [Accumulibacter sp.]|uniref:sulfite exporter TauE/SafE family protein n=1 Tax=Accumulibacter sp. TaxID=2053492 RepID=UPI0025D139B8|nr:sulfite exporter TauE/SafE family protein [Accumulibacter sp.]MDS4048059.1 sulfite exporter TauE/SafE family protein [Accumulibacter sp.]
MVWWLAYVALGLFTGFFAGMLGIGGGLVMVPALTMMFAAQPDFPQNEVMHLALGTSMSVILFTSLASLLAHHRHGAVLWKVVAQITPGILIGTLLGTLVAAGVPSRPLAVFFTCFVCAVAVQMVLDLKPGAARELPGPPGVFAVGTLIGALSSLVAIGGGSLSVPFLVWCNVRVRNAIATSAAIGFPIALGGSLGYLFNGWSHPGLPEWSLGYIHLPAFLWLVPSSMLMAPVGARLAHRLPVATLKRLFAAVLISLAAKMLWGLSGG